MLWGLDGKTAFITGAGAGIGEATAKLFAQQGAGVIVLDRDGSGAEAVAEVIRATGGKAFAASGDVRDTACIDQVIARADAEFGGIHIRSTMRESTLARP